MEASAAADRWRAIPVPAGRVQAAFLPLVVLCDGPRRRRAPVAAELQGVIRRYLSRVGAIVLRGFCLPEDHDFERLVATSDPEPARGHLWAWCAVPVRSRSLDLHELTGLPSGGKAPAPGWRVMRGDGSSPYGLELEQMHVALEACRALLSWQAGDVLLLEGASAAVALRSA
jgi:hypothetical protein